MRTVGAERRRLDIILMTFEGDEARRARPQVPDPRSPVLYGRDDIGVRTRAVRNRTLRGNGA